MGNVDDVGDLKILEFVTGDPQIGDKLSSEHKKELEQLVEEFSDVFTTKLGRTKGVMHNIRTPEGCVVRNH